MAAPPDPPLNGRSFVIFYRGGQTGPPRSNDFFFGAADDTGAADIDRPKTAVNGSDRRETLGKRVSEDSQHFIFRRRKKKIGKNVRSKCSSKKNRRNIDKLPVFAELWIFGRNRQMRLEKLPPKFWFSALYDFWRRGKRDSFNVCLRLSAKLTSTRFVFLLEDTCVPDDKIPEIA